MGKIDRQDYGNDRWSFRQDDNPIREIDCLLGIMSDKQDGCFYHMPDSQDLIPEFPSGKRVERTERFTLPVVTGGTPDPGTS